jgi:hypothetical protein
MTLQRLLLAWLIGAAALCPACLSRHPDAGTKDNAVDHVTVGVVNKGPENLYRVKVYLGEEEFKLGGLAPGVHGSRKFYPRPDQIGQTVTATVGYEDEDEQAVLLEGSTEFKIFPKGAIWFEVRAGKLLAERISKQ